MTKNAKLVMKIVGELFPIYFIDTASYCIGGNGRGWYVVVMSPDGKLDTFYYRSLKHVKSLIKTTSSNLVAGSILSIDTVSEARYYASKFTSEFVAKYGYLPIVDYMSIEFILSGRQWRMKLNNGGGYAWFKNDRTLIQWFDDYLLNGKPNFAMLRQK